MKQRRPFVRIGIIGVIAGLFVCYGPVVTATSKDRAPSSIRLSLEDVVLMSLKNNGDFLVAQYSPVLAGAFEQIERGEYDPQVFAEFRHTRQSTTEISRSTGDQFDVRVRQTDAAAGIRWRTPLGTTIETSVAADKNVSSRTPTQHAARLGISIEQQLLSGFGPRVNLAGIRLAEMDTRASRYELKGFTQVFVAEAEICYWRYVAATEAIQVYEESLKVAGAQLEHVEARISVGALAKGEAAGARSEVAFRKQNLIDAQSRQNAERIKLLYFIAKNDPEAYSLEIQALSRPVIDVSEEHSIETRVKLALQSRPEIAEATLRSEKGELEIQVTRNGLLPRLELFVDLGKTGYADSFSESFANLDGPTYDATVGARFSHTLGNRAARAKQKLAMATTRQAEYAIANLRLMVTNDIHMALNELDRTRRQMAASEETRRFREQALHSEEDKFEVGTGTGLSVALAQRDLLAAQLGEIEARIDYQIARTRLYLAEGTLLERRGISIDP